MSTDADMPIVTVDWSKTHHLSDKELNRAIYHVSLTPDGAILIGHLKEQYGEVSLRGSTTNGIDPYAMAANVGAHDVYIDIKERIEDGNLAR